MMHRTGINTETTAPARRSIAGLERYLTDRLLAEYVPQAEAWCEEVGARRLAEVLDELEDLGAFLGLKRLERKRLTGPPCPADEEELPAPAEARLAALAADKARLAAEAKAAEEARLAAEWNAAEEARLAAEAKAAEEARLAAEAKAAEEARLAAEAKAAEEARLAAEAKAAEKARLAAEAKAAEEARLAAEAEAAEEARMAAEAEAAQEEKAAPQDRGAAKKGLAALPPPKKTKKGLLSLSARLQDTGEIHSAQPEEPQPEEPQPEEPQPEELAPAAPEKPEAPEETASTAPTERSAWTEVSTVASTPDEFGPALLLANPVGARREPRAAPHPAVRPCDATVQVPARRVGALLGVGGEALKALELRTGTTIALLPRAEGSTTRSLHIQGKSRQHVAQAEQAIKAAMAAPRSDRKARAVVSVPASQVSYVIGKNGRTVRAIEEDSGASVKVEQEKGSASAEVVLTGLVEAVAAAREAVLAVLPVVVRLEIPGRRAGALIGFQGEGIRELEKASGATIRVTRGGGSALRDVVVEGNSQAVVDRAVRLIEESVTGS